MLALVAAPGLPALIRLELTTFDWGPLPTLTTVKYLSLDSQDSSDLVSLPHAPHLEHLSINLPALTLPPQFAAPILRTLEIHVQGDNLNFSSNLEPHVTNVRTIQIFAPPPSLGGEPDWAVPLSRLLASARLLEVLTITPLREITTAKLLSVHSIESSPAILSFLPSSSLRNLDVVLYPTPLLARTLPVTVEAVTLAGGADEKTLYGFLTAVFEGKRKRFINLARVRVGVGAREASACALVDEAREMGLVVEFTSTEVVQ